MALLLILSSCSELLAFIKASWSLKANSRTEDRGMETDVESFVHANVKFEHSKFLCILLFDDKLDVIQLDQLEEMGTCLKLIVSISCKTILITF